MPFDQFPQFEAAPRQFISTELTACDTLLDSALGEYTRGRQERGDEIVTEVNRACLVIEARLIVAEQRGWNIIPIRKRYTALRRAVAELDRQHRKRA